MIDPAFLTYLQMKYGSGGTAYQNPPLFLPSAAEVLAETEAILKEVIPDDEQREAFKMWAELKNL